MDDQKKRSHLDWVLAAVFGILGIGGISIGTLHVEINNDVTPVEDRFGWDPAKVEPVEEQPTFATMANNAVGSGEGAVVKLWEYAKAINGGQHFPTFRQQVGDCVANGAANAVNYLQAVQIGRDNPDAEWRSACRQWIYGVSRTAKDLGDGKLGRGDGSVGSWAAKGCERYGILADDHDGVPAYSGQIAREWGVRPGPPQKFFAVAKEFCVRSTAVCKTYADVRDALANGYPVTIASNVGFQMQPVVRDGKHWGKRAGNWNHQMCLIGIDDTAKSPFDGKTGAAYCLNSWGDSAHGQPADDAPPGGFWIDRTTIERIVGQGDSWAYSNFDGFPLRDLNFNIFGAPPADQAVAHFAADGPDVKPVSEATVGLSGDAAQTIGGVSAIACSLALGHAARRRRRESKTLAV
jgi:hypothetical protein